jgi:hypothetical protein
MSSLSLFALLFSALGTEWIEEQTGMCARSHRTPAPVVPSRALLALSGASQG